MDKLRQDIHYAFRSLRRTPAFTAVAILSLAIGIGANTTIFTFVNAVLLRPLPYPAPDRLTVLQEHALNSTNPLNVHPANFLAWRERSRAFDALVLVQTPPLNVIGADGPEQVGRMTATADLFRVFGLAPALGRAFAEEDTRPGGPPIVILGHGFWQRWFGGDPGVIGRPLAVQDGSLTIVGVAPAGFRVGSMEPDVFTPLTIDPANPSATGSRAFQSYGRLRTGVTVDAAAAELSVVAADLRQRYRFDEGMGVFVVGLHDYLAKEARSGLRLLMAVVAVVLAIACVNLAGLLLARGVARRSEFAVRAALGASRARLVRQLAVESVMLAGCGGVLGLTIAYWAMQALRGLTGNTLTAGISEPIRLDATCLLFTIAVSGITALFFGLAPARQASHADPQAALRERGRGMTADRRHHRLRSGLVVTQVALAVVLLVGAGLLLRTLSSLVQVNLGFEPRDTITMGLFLGVRPPETRVAMVDQMLDRIEALPGVKAAGTIQFLPLRGATCGTGFWQEDQAGSADPSRTLQTECSLVSRGYFAAMGIPVVSGRAFDRRDRPGSARVVMVNQAFARRYFPQGSALGRRILVQASNQQLAEIVGVVGDVRHSGLATEPAATVFLLHAQTPGYITNLVVRTVGEPGAQAAMIRRAIHEVDPTQAVSSVGTLNQIVAGVLARPRLQATMVTCFAAIAVLLAAIGVYGLVTYVVTQRTPEIGIRLAIGATRGQVFSEVFGHGARLVAAGLGLGLAAAVALRQALSTLVFGVTTGDPLTYLLASLSFAAIAAAALAIPAHRASRVEPISALRCE